MTTATLTSPLNTDVVARLIGATYRQVDYWVRMGVLRPEQTGTGSGIPRRWRQIDLRAAIVVAQLRRLGAADEPLRAVGRWLYNNVENLDAGWLVVMPALAGAIVEHVEHVDTALELLVEGAWVLPVPPIQ